MAAALHGADFPKARQVRASMTHEQMREFAMKPKKKTKKRKPKADVESYSAY
jgi:hypothetical protein